MDTECPMCSYLGDEVYKMCNRCNAVYQRGLADGLKRAVEKLWDLWRCAEVNDGEGSSREKAFDEAATTIEREIEAKGGVNG